MVSKNPGLNIFNDWIKEYNHIYKFTKDSKYDDILPVMFTTISAKEQASVLKSFKEKKLIKDSTISILKEIKTIFKERKEKEKEKERKEKERKEKEKEKKRKEKERKEKERKEKERKEKERKELEIEKILNDFERKESERRERERKENERIERERKENEIKENEIKEKYKIFFRFINKRNYYFYEKI